MKSTNQDLIVIETEDIEECPVCYEELDSENTVKLPVCSHLICDTCDKTLKKLQSPPKCPLCRTPIDQESKYEFLINIVLFLLYIFWVILPMVVIQTISNYALRTALNCLNRCFFRLYSLVSDNDENNNSSPPRRAQG